MASGKCPWCQREIKFSNPITVVGSTICCFTCQARPEENWSQNQQNPIPPIPMPTLPLPQPNPTPVPEPVFGFPASSYRKTIDDLIQWRMPVESVMNVFGIYQPVYGSSQVRAVYNSSCWAYNLPLEKICWHDSYVGGDGKDSYGKGLAITPRHLLVTSHGTEVEFRWQVWIRKDGSTVIRNTWSSINNIGDGFRILYLDNDLPNDLICDLLDPATTPNLQGVPCLLIRNNTRQASVVTMLMQQFGGIMSFGRSGDSHRDQFYQQATGGDSGSPVFLARGNDIIYLTNLTTSDSQTRASGPSSLQSAQAILKACQDLNARHNGFYLPKFV